ncbi:MarR family winged helix-turn-helix transcriptional regulator [Promicromonospora thailandica]|uniref:DNA-binding transcriptional regulator, MarR family n=1 Tax=Promicromonospora thailandica TaxID=765201 RepID=A0A9X2G6J0_9MICO|nr:MarR family winged helix-turn-helix transcriptional regulator [Promicromonospora thailandica]MCP2266555.1 DNA-binding transcriptional regulator, MarR family [Promicromonospora thailandica]
MTDSTRPRARRSPTPDELRAWRGFIETAQTLNARLTSRLQKESGLTSADYTVLLALSEADGRRLRSSELADAVDWERSRLSHHLRRMENRDLVRRVECADDFRGAEVELTDHGARSFRAASVPHLRAVRELFVDALTPEQLDQVEALTAALRSRLDTAPDRAAG